MKKIRGTIKATNLMLMSDAIDALQNIGSNFAKFIVLTYRSCDFRITPILSMLLFLVYSMQAAQAAGTGTLIVKTARQPGAHSPSFLRIFRLEGDFDTFGKSVKPGNSVKFKQLPSGWYALAVTHQTPGGFKTGYRFAKVVSRKTVTTSIPKALSAMASATPARIRVGQITGVAPDGNPLIQADGSPWNLSNVFIYDLLSAPAACQVKVYDGVDSPVYKALEKELRLQASKYIRKQDRINLSEALTRLRTAGGDLQVQGRVGATEPDLSNLTGSAHFEIVNTKTGQILWSQDYPEANGVSYEQLFAKISTDIKAKLCKKLVPEQIVGDFSGVLISGDDTYEWSGEVGFSLVSTIPPEADPSGVGYAIYRSDYVDVRNFRMHGLASGCSFDETAFKRFDNVGSGLLMLSLSAMADGYPYSVSFAVSEPDYILVHYQGKNCSAPQSDALFADLIGQEDPQITPNRTDLNLFTGIRSEGGTQWIWNLTGF